MRMKPGELFVGWVSGKNSAAALKTARVAYGDYRITRVYFENVTSGFSEKFRIPYSRRNYKVFGVPNSKAKVEILTIEEDRMGNITITNNQDPNSVFLQFQSDKEAIYDILRPSEKQELMQGWSVHIKGNEPRASIIGELWESQNGGN